MFVDKKKIGNPNVTPLVFRRRVSLTVDDVTVGQGCDMCP